MNWPKKAAYMSVMAFFTVTAALAHDVITLPMFFGIFVWAGYRL